MQISVITCTRDRTTLLSKLLDDLQMQTSPRGSFEVIVVDNGERTDTRQMVEERASQLPCLRYVREPRLGLSHARNRGFGAARAEYVAYTDDDCRLPPEWLAVAIDVIQQHRPDIFGGPYRACYESAKPKWFKDEYGSRDLGTKARILGQEETLSGGNIFIRRALLEEIGGFDPNLGMKGSRIAYGEESDFQHRVRAQRPTARFFYDPGLWVYHLVRPEKMSLRWHLRASFGKGRSSYRAGNTKVLPRGRLALSARITYTAAASVADAACALVFTSHRRTQCFQSHLYEQTAVYLRTIGALWGALRDPDSGIES